MRVDAWELADLPDLAGRTVLVTGTTLGGLGHHTALELARRGARVVLAGRTPERLRETGDTILRAVGVRLGRRLTGRVAVAQHDVIRRTFHESL